MTRADRAIGESRVCPPGAGEHAKSDALPAPAPVIEDAPPCGPGSAKTRFPDDEGTRVRVRLTVPFPIVAEVTRAAAAELELDRGGELWVTVKATEIVSYPA